MPQAHVFTDSTAGRANVVMRPMPGLWTDDGPHSARAHTTEPSRLEPEPELRACASVLDLLELALLDSRAGGSLPGPVPGPAREGVGLTLTMAPA
jgi:hypothetical protein